MLCQWRGLGAKTALDAVSRTVEGRGASCLGGQAAPCGPRAECCQASPGWPPGRSNPHCGPCLQLRSLSMPWILSHQPVSSVTEVLPLTKYPESDPPSVLLSLAAVLLLFMLVTPPLARAAVPDAPHASLQSVLAPTL